MQENEGCMIRYTHTEKWDDPWFCDLSPNAKLILYYFREKANTAGFIEFNPRKIAFETGISEKELQGIIADVTTGKDDGDDVIYYVIFKKGWVWMTLHLNEQRNYPVNLNNRAHSSIPVQMQEQAIRFHGVPEFQKLMEEINSPGSSHSAGEEGSSLPIASRDDLKRAPKDWSAVRGKCMSKLHSYFRTDDALRVKFESWWDHRMEMGDPLEIPMWLEFQEQAKPFAPAIIIEAISYSIAAGNKSVNFLMAKKINSERGSELVPPIENTKGLPEPEGWQDAFLAAYQDATVPTSFWTIAKSRRKQLYKHDPDLEVNVKSIEKQ